MHSITSFSHIWKGTSELTGFGGSLPTRSRIAEIQAEYAQVVCFWTKRQVLTVMGVLNAYLYRAAMDTRAIKKDGRLHRGTNRLRAIAQQGIESFNLTQQALCTYLSKHWEGANKSRTTIWKVRDLLVDLGLFQYQKQTFKKAETGDARATAPDIENLDVVKVLILYEYLEELYCNWHGQGFEALPKHRGALMRMLFNAIFRGIARFRRKTVEEREPRQREQDIAVYWENGIGYNINGHPVVDKEGDAIAFYETGDLIPDFLEKFEDVEATAIQE